MFIEFRKKPLNSVSVGIHFKMSRSFPKCILNRPFGFVAVLHPSGTTNFNCDV